MQLAANWVLASFLVQGMVELIKQDADKSVNDLL